MIFCIIVAETTFFMAKKKKDCPSCCTYTITIKEANCNIIWDEQVRLKKLRDSHKSVEYVINKIISEYPILKDHK